MLKEICEETVEKTLSLGSDQAEAFGQKKRVFVAEFAGRTLTQVVERESQGIGVRAIRDKATGFAYSTWIADFEKPAKQAVTSAGIVAPDPFFDSLPKPQVARTLPQVYDFQLAALQIEDVQAAILKIIESNEGGSGTFQITLRECSIANSNGIAVMYRKSDYSCKLSATEVVAASWCNLAEMNSRAMSSFFERVLERKNLPRQKMRWDGRGKIILEPNAVPDFVRPLIMAMNGKNIAEKISFLPGRQHEQVLSDEISLYDDGCYPNGLFTQPVDGEGVPSQRTALIEKGVLKHFIYDTYYAHQLGQESTGNALREGFRNLPTCFFSNLIFREGCAPRDELIGDTQHGILINSLGTSTVDPRTSRIALPISRGFLIEKGEITAATYPSIFTGDILVLLQDVALSREREQVFRFLSPWIRIERQ